MKVTATTVTAVIAAIVAIGSPIASYQLTEYRVAATESEVTELKAENKELKSSLAITLALVPRVVALEQAVVENRMSVNEAGEEVVCMICAAHSMNPCPGCKR